MTKDSNDVSSDLVDINLEPDKSVIYISDNESVENEDLEKERRDLILTHKEAQAGSPDDMAVCGEEDIGAGLEFLVTRNDTDK